MSSHDLSLNGINKTVPVKPDTKTATVEKTESEGFIEELKEVMGLAGKDDAKKTAIDETSDAKAMEVTDAKAESDSSDEKEETTEEKISQGSDLLSRLDLANNTLVSKDGGHKEEDGKAEQHGEESDESALFDGVKWGTDKSGTDNIAESNSELLSDTKDGKELKDVTELKDGKDTEEGEPVDDIEVLLTQASMASEQEKNSGKTVAEKTDPVKEIQWGSTPKSAAAAQGELSTKGDATGNKESTKELLTSTALIGKAEAEAGKTLDTQKGKMDISALGMTQVANGESLNVLDTKSSDSFAQQLAQLSGTSATQSASLTPAQKADPINVPLNIRHEMVSDEVAERINMMMAKNLKHVDIRLDPPEMGRMHIRLNMGADNASVQFTVSNQQAREAIEQTLPRLREMFAQQGIQLADTSVQQQNSGESSQYAYQQGDKGQQSGGFSEDGLEEQEISVQVSKPDDGISFYA